MDGEQVPFTSRRIVHHRGGVTESPVPIRKMVLRPVGFSVEIVYLTHIRNETDRLKCRLRVGWDDPYDLHRPAFPPGHV